MGGLSNPESTMKVQVHRPHLSNGANGGDRCGQDPRPPVPPPCTQSCRAGGYQVQLLPNYVSTDLSFAPREAELPGEGPPSSSALGKGKAHGLPPAQGWGRGGLGMLRSDLPIPVRLSQKLPLTSRAARSQVISFFTGPWS